MLLIIEDKAVLYVIFTDIIIDRYRVYNNLLDIFSFTLEYKMF